MKRILKHTAFLLLIVFLLPVCSAEARRYDFKVLLEEERPKLSADGTYFYVEGPSGTYTIPDYVPAQDDTPRNHIEEYDWLDPKYKYASKATCGRIFVSEQPLPEKLEDHIGPNSPEEAIAFRDSLYMDLTLMDLKGNIIMDGLQSNVYVRRDGWGSMTGPKTYYQITYRESQFTPTGIAYVKRDGKYGIIDPDGNLLLDFTLDEYEPCKGYLGEKGYIISGLKVFDPYGNIYADFTSIPNRQLYDRITIAPPEYNTAIVYNMDTAKYGLIDDVGNIVLPLEYDFIGPLQKNAYRVEQYTGKNYLWGIYDIETQTVDWWEDTPNSFSNSYLEKSIIKSYVYIDGGYRYYNEDFELVCDCKNNAMYDAQGNVVEGAYGPIDYPLTDGINVYSFGYRSGLVAINEIPEPQAADGGHYICMMLDNPLINVDGNVSTIVENNYFFKPPLENDRTLVPMRVIFEALGAQVEWDGETQTVTATKDGKTMRLQIDKNELYVGDEMVRLDTPPRLIEGNTLVPLRAVSESFGATVLWDDDTRLITITWA